MLRNLNAKLVPSARFLPPTLDFAAPYILCLAMFSGQIQAADTNVLEASFDSQSLRQALHQPGFRPKLDVATIDVLAKLDDHRRKGEWLKLFRLVDEHLPDIQNQMVPVSDRLWISIGEYYRGLLRTLPTDGLDQFRLLFDARSRAALTERERPLTVTELWSLYNAYAMTSTGDQIANQLGDALFEMGDFAQAIRCWQSVLDHHPSSSLSPARLILKQVIAARRGLPDLVPQYTKLLAAHMGMPVTVGPNTQTIADHLQDESWRPGDQLAENAIAPEFHPTQERQLVWSTWWPQVEKTALTLPGVLNDGTMCLVHLGPVAGAFDQMTGKLVWIHRPPKPTRRPPSDANRQRILLQRALIVRSLRTKPPAINVSLRPASDGHRFFVSMLPGLTDSDQFPLPDPQLVALSKSDGHVAWVSSEVLSQYQIAGSPYYHNRQLFVPVHRPNSNELRLVSLDPETGSLLWELPLGSISTPNFSGWRLPWIKLQGRESQLYVATGEGAVVAVDVLQRQLRWVFKFDSPNRPFDQRVPLRIVGGRLLNQNETTKLILDDDQLFLKNTSGTTVACFDDWRQRCSWQTDLTVSARLMTVDRERVYLLDNAKVVALDRQTGEKAWETVLLPEPKAGAICQAGRLYVPSRDGIVVIDSREGSLIQLVSAVDGAAEAGRFVRGPENQIIALSRNSVSLFDLR